MTENLGKKFNTVQSSLFDEMEVALIRKDLAAIASLLKLGAHVDQTDHGHNTPLIIAAIKGDTALAQLAIAKCADLEVRNKNGSTALLLATANRRPEIVRLLIDAGADVNKNDDDYVAEYGSALKWAEKRGFDEIAQMLREAPAVHRRVTAEAAAIKAEKEKARTDALVLKRRALKDIAQKRKVTGPAP